MAPQPQTHSELRLNLPWFDLSAKRKFHRFAKNWIILRLWDFPPHSEISCETFKEAFASKWQSEKDADVVALQNAKIHLCDNFTQWLIEDFHSDSLIFSSISPRVFSPIQRIKALTCEREIVETNGGGSSSLFNIHFRSAKGKQSGVKLWRKLDVMEGLCKSVWWNFCCGASKK